MGLNMKKETTLCYQIIAVIILLTWINPKITYAQSSTIEIGISEVNITPPVGYDQYRGTSTGVHDPLYAKAIVFQNENEVAALVVCDLISITSPMSIEIRTAASDQTGIPYSNIIVAATHTHTGPRHHAPVNDYISRKQSGELTTSEQESYEALLLSGIVESIVDAHQNRRNVYVESGSGIAEDISFNRRFIMKDGKVGWNPGIGNPSIVRPAGPIDPEVGIIMFRNTTDSELAGSLTSFANHTDTVGGTEFSADYPGYLANALREGIGENFISVFGMGTSGDINHIDVKSDDTIQRGHESVTRPTGEKLAEVVLNEIPNLIRATNSTLGVRSEIIYAPLQDFTDNELRWALKEEREPFYNERPFLQRFRANKIRSLESMRNSGEAIPPTVGTENWTFPVEVQVIQIGEHAAIVGLPGEVFVELGMAIKESSPFETTLIVELTNKGISYVPTKEAFAQGEYETINSRLAPGGGELMVEAAIRMLNDLHKNKINR